jgi:hypothetical protein
VVRRIFRLFDQGEGKSGPLLYEEIAQTLMDEGFKWAHDLQKKMSRPRTEFTRDLIYSWQIRRCLTDCCYQARQKYYGVEHDCPAFLIDGEPVINPALYERVQAKITGAKRVGNRGKSQYAFSGLIRCGLCGQGLHAASRTSTNKAGETRRFQYWNTIKSKAEGWAWCDHKFPILQNELVESYVDEVLGPLLEAEFRDRISDKDRNNLLDVQAQAQRKLRELEHRYREVLPTYIGHVTPQLLKATEDRLIQEMSDQQKRLMDAELKMKAFSSMEVDVSKWRENPAARRDAIRNCIRWVAIFDSGKDREPSPHSSKRSRPARDAGRLLFLSSWGTTHCAKIVRASAFRAGNCHFTLLPAEPDEAIGGVAEFPDPEGFLLGLERAYKGNKYPYHPDEVAPGYRQGSGTDPLAEFAAEFEEM